LKSSRILAIDDNPTFRALVAHHLAECGYSVIEAGDGAQGIELFMEQKPDAVLIDLRMPGMDGLAVLTELADCSAEVPLIVISGESETGDAVKAIRKGAWDFVIKNENVLSDLHQSLLKTLGRASFLRSQRERLDFETSERLRAEEDLRTQLSFVQTLIDAIPNQIFYKDMDGRYLGCNAAFEKLAGYPREQLLGRCIEDFAPQFETDLYLAKDQELKEAGGSQEFESSITINGEFREFLLRKALFSGGNGEPGGIVGVVTDISRQKEIERNLRQSEEMFRTLLESSPLPVIIVGAEDRRILFVNRQGIAQFGAELADVTGLSTRNFYANSADHEELRQLMQREGSIRGREVEMLRCDGSRFWALASAVPLQLDGKSAFFITFSDITKRKDLEATLRRFEFIANASHDLMTLCNRDFVFEAANASYLEQHKCSREEIVGRSQAEVWGEEIFELRIRPHFESCLKGETVSYKAWFSFPVRERRYYEVVMSPYFDADGRVTHVATVSRDVTESEEAQRAILESREHFRAIFEGSVDPILLLDKDLHITDVNTATIAKLGFKKGEIIGQSVKLLHKNEQDFQQLRSIMEPMLLGSGAWVGEWSFNSRQGRAVTMETSVSLLKPDVGWGGGCVAVMRDMTFRVEAEKARRESEQRYRAMFESTGSATVIINRDMTIAMANQQFAEQSGYSCDEVEGRLRWTQFIPDEELPRMLKYHEARRINPSAVPNAYEFQFRTRSGELRHLHGEINMLPGTDKSIASLIDITERKMAENRLRETLDEMEAIHHNAFIGIGLFNDETIVRLNNRCAEIFGYAPDSLISTDAGRLFRSVKEYQSFRRRCRHDLVSQGEFNTEQAFIKPDGTTVWVNLFARPVDRSDLDQGVIWTVVDVTERRYNETVTSMLYRISAAVSTTSDLDHLYVRIHDILNRNISASNFFIALLDKSRSFLEFTYYEDELDDSQRGAVFNINDEDLGSLSVEVIHSGRPLLITRKQLPDVTAHGLGAGAQDAVYMVREDYLHSKGIVEDNMIGPRSEAWLGVPLRVRGEVVGVMAVQSYSNPYQYAPRDVDLTVSVSEQIALAIERKANDRDLLKAKEQAEAANESKSEFLANMSHEVRTPLNGVLGMLQLVQTTELSEEQRDYVDTALASGRSLLSIINDILDFSKIEAGRMEVVTEPFTLDHFLRDVLSTFQGHARDKGLELTSRIGRSVPGLLVGGKSRLRQVVFNLVGNALKFTESGGVEVGVDLLGRNPQARTVRVLISVRDTGIGIPDDKISQIFEPFTQVDGSYVRRHQGTGLGLGIVKRLADLLGGVLSVESEEGRGTTVYLSLNLGYDPAQGAEDGHHSRLASGRKGLRLLVVEDNRVNRLMAARMLGKLGHVAETASNGQEALDSLGQRSFDAVFMDIQMAGMDGVETTNLIRKGGYGDPNIPVIAMTAHAMSGDRETFLGVGMNDYIAKPVELEEIEVALARLFPET